MKKTLAILIVLAMLTTMSLSVFAADVEIDSDNKTSTQNVTATYNPAEESDKIYQVDITWGSMEFTYNEAYQGVWNPETHVYENATEAGWTCTSNANKVTVVNHSNDSITVKMTYSIASEYQNSITEMYWTDNTDAKITSLTLGSADNGLGIDGAGMETTGEMYLKLNGTMSATNETVTLGTVTIALEDNVTQ